MPGSLCSQPHLQQPQIWPVKTHAHGHQCHVHLQNDLYIYKIHAMRCLQKDMLEDHKRTGAYYQAVMQNRRQFEGKVVLDVGTGSGILAIFAAKAGARKVYAVEATPMAKFAQSLVEHNGVSLTPLAAAQTV